MSLAPLLTLCHCRKKATYLLGLVPGIAKWRSLIHLVVPNIPFVPVRDVCSLAPILLRFAYHVVPSVGLALHDFRYFSFLITNHVLI